MFPARGENVSGWQVRLQVQCPPKGGGEMYRINKLAVVWSCHLLLLSQE